MYYLCEKYYKPITVQYYIADCVSCVPRLNLLDLRTNWTYELTLGTELIHIHECYQTKHSSQYSQLTGKLSQKLENLKWHILLQQTFFTKKKLNF